MIAESDGKPDWVLGFQDEVWWTRLSQPSLSAWAPGGEPLRLLPPGRDGGGGREALACYGILRRDTGGMMLRFVEGRPVSQVTEEFLGWACGEFARQGKRVFVLVWDNAAWHASKRVRAWITGHNREAKEVGGVRIVACFLPVKSTWLNPIEPKWAHGKKAIVEPERMLSADEVRSRVCDYYGCERLEPLEQLSA